LGGLQRSSAVKVICCKYQSQGFRGSWKDP